MLHSFEEELAREQGFVAIKRLHEVMEELELYLEPDGSIRVPAFSPLARSVAEDLREKAKAMGT